jgi:uncharacterized protein YjbI with pentapeptide repeats
MRMADDGPKTVDGTLSDGKSSVPQSAEAPTGHEEALSPEQLRLEVESLRRDLSRRNTLMEWMKAASGPVAVLGLIISTIITSLQMGAAREAGLEDRFQKQVTHLGSSSATEKLTGVAGLSFILGDRTEAKRHREAVSFLVNALAVETDATVRGAIVEVIGQLDARNPDQAAVASDALQLLISRNRQMTRLHHFSAEELAPNGAEASQQLGTIVDTGNLIARLIRQGASPKDLSEIACLGCDFSGSKYPRGVSFSGAVLANANFSGANLAGANFLNASLQRVKFVGANLQDANFGEDPVPHQRRLTRETAELLSQSSQSPNPPAFPPGGIFANFKCANLQNANFDGRTLLGLYKGGVWPSESVDFSGAKLDGADLRSFAILYADENAKNIVDFSASVPFSSMRSTLFGSATNPNSQTALLYSVVTTDAEWRFDRHSPKASLLDDLAYTLLSSKNLNEAKLAPEFKDYLNTNHFDWTVAPTDCSAGSKTQ